MRHELEIRTLTDRFFDGTTTRQEEARLYELYRSEELLEDLLALREMMLDMAVLGPDEKAIGKKRNGVRFKKTLTLAASILLLIGIGTIWYGLDSQEECVAYIYGKRTTDRDVVLREMQMSMAALTTDEVTAAAETQLKELFTE